MDKINFRVKYGFEIDGELREGIEEEASWFLIDQRGTFYSHGPMQPVRPCGSEYKYLIPMIKINGKYMSVDDIEKRCFFQRKKNKEGLKKCPFCGSVHTFIDDGIDDKYFVRCNNCNVTTVSEVNKEDAIYVWNLRDES